ncbi:hypothetical protein PX699_11635 [Sphingobium sp. H39-3-25]|uniref:hypothetical protein n=1 Tax=Sphingobium arseniciresistens TaxID=3030834 RepID=UPI0023B8D7A6|nr:hypothetical protein [Sphingobium arseniciresistens]
MSVIGRAGVAVAAPRAAFVEAQVLPGSEIAPWADRHSAHTGLQMAISGGSGAHVP